MFKQAQFREFKAWNTETYFSRCFKKFNHKSEWWEFSIRSIFSGTLFSGDRFDTFASIQFEKYDHNKDIDNIK